MLRRVMLGGLVLALAGSFSMAGAGQKWLHIRVEEDDEQVFINLPFNFIQEVLPLIKVENLDHGKLRIDVDELGDTDLRAVWESLREAEDGEYVTVQGEDENVRIAKIGEHFVIKVDEDDEQVDMKIRTVVLDALFSGDEEGLDLMAALDALGREEECELITVRDGDEYVRIWIDANKSAE